MTSEVKADDAEEEVEEFKKPPLAAGPAGFLRVWGLGLGV